STRHSDPSALLVVPTRRSSDLAMLAAVRDATLALKLEFLGFTCPACWTRAPSADGSSCDACRRMRSPARARRSVLRSGASSVCRSEEHTSELQSRENLVCRLLL